MTAFNHFPSWTGGAQTIAPPLTLGGAALPAVAETCDLSIEDRPSEVGTAQMIATAPEVPADGFEQPHYTGFQFDHEMDADDGQHPLVIWADRALGLDGHCRCRLPALTPPDRWRLSRCRCGAGYPRIGLTGTTAEVRGMFHAIARCRALATPGN